MGHAAIICIDDERIILDGLKSQLGREFGEDYTIEIAESGEEAMELVEDLLAYGTDIPIVISDQLMPGLKGHEVLRKIYKISPATYTVLLTGQSDIEAITEAVNHANLYRYISKPWEKHDLILTIKEAIKGYYQDKKLAQQNILLERHNKELGVLVDERTEELKLANIQLVQSEKLAAFGEVATRMSHEILNPLNFIQNFSALSNHLILDLLAAESEADKKETAELLIKNLKKINEHGNRAVSILKELQEYTNRGNAHEFFEDGAKN